MRRRCLYRFGHFVLALFAIGTMQAQDLEYARQLVDTLTSPSMHGRGYVSEGHKISANFIQGELERHGVKAFQKAYQQTFDISVNTFPNPVSLSINGEALEPGVDFIVDPCSPNGAMGAKAKELDPELATDKDGVTQEVLKRKYRGKFLWLDERKVTLEEKEQRQNYEWTKGILKYAQEPMPEGLVIIQDKLTWHMSPEVCLRPTVYLADDAIDEEINEINLAIDGKFEKQLETQNVIGYIPGKEQPDSMVIFSAHYDHLGRMGPDVYFPGANDDASGVSLVIDLARHYSENPPKYTTVFMFFGAEEVGLLGSKHFVEENRWFELDKVKFMLNLDIMGTGDEGITAVNGRVFEDHFNRLVTINEKHDYLKKVKPRGKAANSDHHFFTEEGVPAFFIYTMGGISAYHDVYDKAETLPLTEYEDIFKLLTEFVEGL